MSCLPNIPIAFDRRTSGWVEFPTPYNAGAATQYWPLSQSVITLPSIAEAAGQIVTIKQVSLREKLTSGTLRSQAFDIHFWNAAGATPPTFAAVYEPSTTNYIGVVQIVAGNYKRQSSTCKEAYVFPELQFETVDNATSVNLYAVAVFAEGTPTDLDASHTMFLNVFTELAQTTS